MKNEIFEEIKKKAGEVDREIERLVPRDFGELMDRDFADLRWGCDVRALSGAIAKPMWDLMDRGGKRWRPFLMKLCYEAVGGGESIDKFLPIVEVIHNGTLIVDDIEDVSDCRRGKPCIHKIYGDDIAINAGNAMYYLPMLSVVRDAELEMEKKVRVYELINEEMIKLSFGQGMDIFWHKGNGIPNENEYLQMCAFKTGTLARISAKLGGILGGANDEIIAALGEFAESIGVAFQIQDDILNICPGEDWGKDFGDDVSEGKRTLLIIQALKVIGEEDARDLVGILNLRTKNKVIIGEAIGILKNSGVIGYANEVARDLVLEAWKKLDLVLSPRDDSDEPGVREARDKLKMFSDFVVEREI